MKTVLHTIDTTGPGGAETVFIELVSNLLASNYRPIVVIRGKGWVYDQLIRRNVKPIILDAKGSFNWKYLLGLYKIIKDYKIDLIQSHLLGSNVYCSIAGIITGTPVVATFHGAVDIGTKERLKWLKFLAINMGSDRIIAVSRELRDDIFNRTSLLKSKTKIIYNGIDTNYFKLPKRRDLHNTHGWNADDVVIGSLGNIRPAKAYNLLLDAARILLNRGHNKLRFVIAGQPDKNGLYQSLLDTREHLKLDQHVIFLGFIDDTAEYLSSLDLFLSTSLSEGLPLSAIQAMAAGVPLIATRCGGYDELVTDRENGLLVKINDPVAIADGLEELIYDKDVRDFLIKNAQKHVSEQFDISTMLRSYSAEYDALT